jgi:hypothetical protein
MPISVTRQDAFRGVRADFMRLSDARVLHGWVERIDGAHLVIRARVPVAVQRGEAFHLQIFGLDGDATFRGKLVEVESEETSALLQVAAQIKGSQIAFDEQLYVFEVASEVKESAPKQDARINTECATVLLGRDRDEAIVVDLATNGIGAISSKQYAKELVIPIRLFAGAGVIDTEAEVRYCRRISKEPETYRIGLRFTQMDRINENRWRAIFGRQHA